MAFTISFPLKLEKWQSDFLDKKLYIMSRYYNELAFELNTRLNNIKEDKEYILEVEKIKNMDITEDKKIQLFKKNKSYFIKKYLATPEGVRKTKGMELLKKRSQYDNYLLTSEINTTIVRGSLDKAYKSGKIHYKKRNEGLNSFDSQIPKASSGSIKINPKTFDVEIGSPNLVKTIKCKFKVNKNDSYAFDVLNQIKQDKNGWISNESSGVVRLKRKQRKNKNYFYIEIILKDSIIKPKTTQTTMKGNRVGVDIGATTVAWFDGQNTYQEQLGSSVKLIQESKQKQRLLQRKLDRQRRANNPENYNEDGTVKKGCTWKYSNNYKKTKGQLQNISHKITKQRKELLNKIANNIILSGDNILIEKMDWKKLTKNHEGVIINPDNGKNMSNKRFGKLVGENAPSTLTEVLKQKIKYINGTYHEVNTFDTKLSQFNHITGEYTKKPLSVRENNIDGHLIGRDTYSAMLIRNVDINGKKHVINLDGVNSDWSNFLFSESERYRDIQTRIMNGENLSRAMIPDSIFNLNKCSANHR